MTKILIILFVVALSFSVVACDGEDGKNGVMGITGPSGVDELSVITCAPGEALESVREDNGTVTLTCVAP